MSSNPPPPLARAQSHQSGTIANHWNDLPAGYIPSPTNSTSRSASRNSNVLSPGANGSSTSIPRTASPLKPVDTSNQTKGADAQITPTIKPLSTLLPALYNLPTSLPQSERNMLQTRINKSLLPATGNGGVTEAQRTWVQELLHGFIVEETVDTKTCREEIVAFMRRESGVAGWAGSVRKVVESVIGK
ncbi:hypothetical protein H072_9764 [Dactylellina haptotyla CBS 200.50]|uniref:Uncharacterized protein n=1 Tax=Dactylellina haptotyla (strain CBS 200.50) TaxID=1284197 RepID=S8A6C0_DACHA|nr:hypothetical protein H072_9764 [Dactylellina haptotyla CBS 200.50]